MKILIFSFVVVVVVLENAGRRTGRKEGNERMESALEWMVVSVKQQQTIERSDTQRWSWSEGHSVAFGMDDGQVEWE